MNQTDKHITPAEPQEPQAPKENRKSAIAWTALVLAVISWCMLFWSNGYVALAVAVLAVVAGFAACSHNASALRRLAITALIAALVLIVVVSAYLIVLKVGMS